MEDGGMIVSQAEYKTLDEGGEIVRYRLGKLKTAKPATSKSGFTNGPVTVRHNSGEVHELATFRGRENQSPEPIDAVRTVRYREEKPIWWQQGDPLPPLTGDPLTVIVTDAVFCQMDSGEWKWRITYQRTGPHRPIPDSAPGVYMAPTTGYGSRVHSIDREAPVIPDEYVLQFRADELEAKRDANRQRITKVTDAVQEAVEGRHDLEPKARRKLEVMERIAAELADLLDGEAA